MEVDIEKAVRFLSNVMPTAEELIKPTLFHSIRVGDYLYRHDYGRDIVLAGFLHDVIEDTDAGFDEIAAKFGENVASLVAANSKDDDQSNEDLIKQCVAHGTDATIVKAADILDNSIYYKRVSDQKGIAYCEGNARTLFKIKPPLFTDRIFTILKETTGV